MKLKKAMKKYEIKIVGNCGQDRYFLGNKYIVASKLWPGLWWNSAKGDMKQYTEELAVAWLIEGATPLSPMERAMRKWPIEDLGTKNNNLYHTYKLGDREVFQSSSICIGKWLNGIPMDRTIYTEKEAVAYLLEGYKGGDPKLRGMTLTVDLKYSVKESQGVMDALWGEGYRPTKDTPIS
jgi:hypothetical protein